MDKYKQRNFLRYIKFILLVIIVWEMLCSFKLVDPLFLPAPSKIFDTTYNMFKTGEMGLNILISLKRIFFGFILGCILGIFIGSLCGVSERISFFLEPLVYATSAIPRFSLLPFMIFIFGFGLLPKVVFIGMGVFFPLAINTISGINYIKKYFLEVARHYGAGGWNLYRRVILPGSLPFIFSGLRISIGVSIGFAMVVEFLTASDGIGALMWLSMFTLRIDKLFSCIIIVTLLSIIISKGLRLFEHFIMPWEQREKEESGE